MMYYAEPRSSNQTPSEERWEYRYLPTYEKTFGEPCYESIKRLIANLYPIRYLTPKNKLDP